ncbi:TetR/AcrR family transcriptional regulator [Luteococcus sp.]|uniref:TetR/AcrR family transcriptional regulator n=1 Tax=Luteococcus sp. TaxID=1969402 RepID=UPI003736688D
MSEPERGARRLDPATRRAAILASARIAFASRPYAQVSLAAVGRDAGVSEALVHKYFDGKAGLFAELTQEAVDLLLTAQAEAQAALPPGSSRRDRVRTSLLVHLDHVASHPAGWAAPLMGSADDPEAARAVRQAATQQHVALLQELLGGRQDLRSHYAIHGYLGHVQAACLSWSQRGCPDEERWPLVEAALGALEGALGDWG